MAARSSRWGRNNMAGMSFAEFTGQQAPPVPDVGNGGALPGASAMSFEDFTTPNPALHPGAGKLTGAVPNLAAGANETIAGFLGAPPDIVNTLSYPAAVAGRYVGARLRELT